MTLTALSLTEAKYAWVIKPVEPDEVIVYYRVYSVQENSENKHP